METNQKTNIQSDAILRKPSILSISPSAASNVLKSLNVNCIDCKYMGLDQSGRILMEIGYTDSQSKLITDLIVYMEQTETMVFQIAGFVNEFIEKRQREQLVKLAELKKKNRDKENARRDLIS